MCGKMASTQPIRIRSEKDREVILLNRLKYLQNVQCHPIFISLDGNGYELS